MNSNIDPANIRTYTLSNSQGTKLTVLNLGAIISQLYTADCHGELADIVLGFDDPTDYIANDAYFGAVVGRYGNRIARGQFRLENNTYSLASNDGKNHLHGGIEGFNNKIWQVLEHDDQNIHLCYVSIDGEEGYPGELTARVHYSLGDDNSLTVRYQATTTKPTIVNLTQHSYFNLAGHNSGNILNHNLYIDADAYTEIDPELIPTGRLNSVENTPLDFRNSTPVGRRINDAHQQLKYGSGYDHNWVLNKTTSGHTKAGVQLHDPSSGRVLKVFTDQPGVQIYTGNFLDGSLRGKSNFPYQQYSGIAIETQHFPNSPNQGKFPSTRLNPGEAFESCTRFEFGVANYT